MSLDPAEATIAAGAEITYQAAAQDAYGNSWDVTGETSFSVEAAAGGAWVENLYTSENVGTWLITGSFASLTGNANLTVADHGPAVSLTLVPAAASVAAGDTMSYQAVASDAYGNDWDVTGDTLFSIEAGAGGSWADHVYTSEFIGDWLVYGDYAGLTGTAFLSVTPGTGRFHTPGTLRGYRHLWRQRKLSGYSYR